jgi:hypothetical protein
MVKKILLNGSGGAMSEKIRKPTFFPPMTSTRGKKKIYNYTSSRKTLVNQKQEWFIDVDIPLPRLARRRKVRAPMKDM